MLDGIVLLEKKLRLRHYKSLFGKIKERSGSLSATEAYSADVIYLLGEPTIKQFADCLGISQPNATYKVASLIEKGYVSKVPSEKDRREYRLQLSDKFYNYYDSGEESLKKAAEKLRSKFSEAELDAFARVLSALGGELE